MSQQPMEDDEQVSVPGEGDEIMEEPEEQEDGYSTSISHFTQFIVLRLLPRCNPFSSSLSSLPP